MIPAETRPGECPQWCQALAWHWAPKFGICYQKAGGWAQRRPRGHRAAAPWLWNLTQQQDEAEDGDWNISWNPWWRGKQIPLFKVRLIFNLRTTGELKLLLCSSKVLHSYKPSLVSVSVIPDWSLRSSQCSSILQVPLWSFSPWGTNWSHTFHIWTTKQYTDGRYGCNLQNIVLKRSHCIVNNRLNINNED